MQTTSCPYVKISETEAAKNMAAISAKEQASLEATRQAIAREESKTQSIKLENKPVFSFVPRAYAQETTQPQSVGQSLNSQLTLPFLLLIGAFLLFVILMSVVYVYHWLKFSLNDPFIKNFFPVFFFGLIMLTIPLIFNLFF